MYSYINQGMNNVNQNINNNEANRTFGRELKNVVSTKNLTGQGEKGILDKQSKYTDPNYSIGCNLSLNQSFSSCSTLPINPGYTNNNPFDENLQNKNSLCSDVPNLQTIQQNLLNCDYPQKPALTQNNNKSSIPGAPKLCQTQDTLSSRLESLFLKDIQYCSSYNNDIFNHLLSTQHLTMANPEYMKMQSGINDQMRAVLVDWIIEIHEDLQLRPETLYLGINIIDRFLSLYNTKSAELQLIGATAIYISSKLEEIYPPTIEDFVYLMDGAHDESQVFKMEAEMLTAMKFDLTSVVSYHFLDRFVKFAGLDEKSAMYVRYTLEAGLMQYKLLMYQPSLITAAAVFLTKKINQQEPAWSETMIKCTQYFQSDLRPCAKDLVLILKKASQSSLQNVRQKFKQTQYYEVADMKLFA